MADFLFYRIREESNTMYSKESSLNIEEDLEER